MELQHTEPLRVGDFGTISVFDVKREGDDLRVTYIVRNANIKATSTEVVDSIKLFIDSEAEVRWDGAKPEFIFSRLAIGGVKNWFAFNLVAQKKFMDVFNHFNEELDQVVDGC